MTHKVSEPACLLAPRVGHVVKKHGPHAATRDPQTIRETTYKIILDNVRNYLTITSPTQDRAGINYTKVNHEIHTQRTSAN